YTPYSDEAIPPAYFFPFIVFAAIVSYTYFIYADIFYSANFSGDLGFNPKSFFVSLNAFYYFVLKHFITGFPVIEVHSRNNIGKKSEQFVANRMPEEEHPVRTATHKS